MLVNATEMLLKARDGHYAVGQFNINNLEWTKSVLLTAQEMNSPVILGVSEGAGKYMTGFKTVAAMVKAMDESLGITVPVALHLDHGTYEGAKACIEAGFTSIMFDGSHYPIDENVAKTTELVALAHENGLSIEAEVGSIGGEEDGVIGMGEVADPAECAKIAGLGIDFLAAGIGKAQLSLGVDVDLGNAQRDGLLDHVSRDARAAVQDQGDVIGSAMDLVQSLEVQALPVGGVLAVDVADTGSQEVDAQGSDLGTLSGVSNLAHADDAVLFTADGTNLSLDGQAVVMGQGDQFGGLGNVLVDVVVAAIEHDGSETGGNAGLSTLIGAVVQVQGNGNGDAQAFVHGLDHGGNGLEAGHIFASTLRNAEDDGGVHLLRGEQNALGPFQVVDVELTDSIVAIACFQQHIGSIYQHITYLQMIIERWRWRSAHRYAYYNPTLTKNQQANCRTVMHFWRTVPRTAGVCKNLAVLSPKRGSLGQEISFFPS